jgi:DNA primase
MKKLSCAEARQIDLVDFLNQVGHLPKKIKGNDYWYLSPFREEKNPSFKVNRKFNVWYDHGLGKGGNLVDFGILYYRIPVNELLEKLEQKNFFFTSQLGTYLKRKRPVKKKRFL